MIKLGIGRNKKFVCIVILLIRVWISIPMIDMSDESIWKFSSGDTF